MPVNATEEHMAALAKSDWVKLKLCCVKKFNMYSRDILRVCNQIRMIQRRSLPYLDIENDCDIIMHHNVILRMIFSLQCNHNA